MKRGKKYVEAAKKIDRQTLYEATDAIALVKQSAVASYNVWRSIFLAASTYFFPLFIIKKPPSGIIGRV